jgi:hypothetical protein
VEGFVSRHASAVIGVLSGFDRVVFRGTLRLLAHRGGLMNYLSSAEVLLKDFGDYAQKMTQQLREASEALAQRTDRPIQYLASSATNKETVAREIARTQGIERGLICILEAVEPCLTYEIVRKRDAKLLDLEPRRRKCLYLYHYQIHPLFGFMHARIQTWFPFAIQVCLNGREWLGRSMVKAGLRYVQRDNCFIWLEDVVAAQRLMNQQVRANWPQLLEEIKVSLNPQHEAMFAVRPIDYYWTAYQSEWATDILFRDATTLARLYPRLVHHGLTTFFSPDVMRFLGRNIPPSGRLPPGLKLGVVSDMKARPEGVRLKHRVGDNAIKMYDKQGSVLRIETTINDVTDFKAFRRPEGNAAAPRSWRIMRKGIADLHRRAAVSQAANDRYLQAIASVEETTSVGELAARLCQPAKHNGRPVRALNPYAPEDARLLETISRGEFTLNGFRNRDLRRLLFDDEAASPELQRRHAAAVTRKLAFLRAHRLIRKVPASHRYQLTTAGRTIVTALITARNASTETLTRLAA